MKWLDDRKHKKLYASTPSIETSTFVTQVVALQASPEYLRRSLLEVCVRLAIDEGYEELKPPHGSSYEQYVKSYAQKDWEGASTLLSIALAPIVRRAPIHDSGLYYPLREEGSLGILVNNIMAPFCSAKGKRLFPKLYNKLADNLERAKFVHPPEYKGDVEAYLTGTKLLPLLDAPVSLDIPWPVFFEHMHIVGGSGSGKTQWLAQHILRTIETQASIVVVDSQGDLIPRLQTLKSIQDRVLYINPRQPPSIHLFGEGSIEIFDYLFSGIIGADLTAKQSVFFRMMARLLQSIPGATILDMFYMMNDVGPYKQHIHKLPQLQRLFFEQDFNSKTFSQTKEQVRYRLNALLENATMQQLLGPSSTPLNLEKALNGGAVILVDTSKEHLKSASPAFGRIFLALILQAIYNRASIPEGKRRPTFLIIDEAQEYFDENIDDLLTQVRKYRCGLVLAHQYLGQCTPQLRESLAANTSIKMVSGVSSQDARALAPELRTTTDFILSKRPLEFATYVRNVTDKAVSVQVTPGLLDNEAHVERITVQHTAPPQPIHTPTEPTTEAKETW